MTENGIYFAKSEFYDLIRKAGGEWNDKKERPLVCLIRSAENDNLFWCIPMGNWKHRDEKAKQRILSYINDNKRSVRSAYYHIGNTTVKSIFFISDVVPITDKYIDREYLGFDDKPYIILNDNLTAELQRKLKIILHIEAKNPNSFRQHITDVKKYLLNELQEENKLLLLK